LKSFLGLATIYIKSRRTERNKEDGRIRENGGKKEWRINIRHK
jgi:hypothetical protein